MRSRLLLALSFILAAVLCASAAGAQIKMEITGAGSKLSAIAVPPLKDLGGDEDHGISNEFVSTLTRNLELSGYFRIIDPKSYAEDSQSSGFQLGQFNFADWSSINAEFVVKGGISVKGGDISVEAYLFDVAQQRQATGKRYSGSRQDVQRMGRRLADAIIQAVTGTRGPFDSRIAFVSTRGGRFKEIFTMSVDGQNLFRVTNNTTINIFPSFDRTSRQLLYTSFKTGSPALYVVDLPSQRETRIQNGLGQIVGGALSPDGNSVAAAIERNGATNLFLLDRSGAVIRTLTQGGSINVSPSFSQDGGRMAFTSDRAGSPQIYVTNVAGGDARRITYQGSYNSNPSLSPKGDRIAYQSRQQGVFDIYVVGADDGQPTRLTQGEGSNQEPSWSPDGRYLVFTSTREGAPRLYLMQVESGKIISALTEENGNDTSPVWSAWLGE